jgi:CRP-like cAMP-binding protein
LRGTLHVVVRSNAGVEAEVSQIHTGDFFGETAIFNPGATAGASVRAMMYCELESLPFDGLRKLMADDTSLASEIKAEARANFVKIKNLSRGKIAPKMKQGAALSKAMQKKYKQDSTKFDMISRLHAAASGVSNPSSTASNPSNTSNRTLRSEKSDDDKVHPYPDMKHDPGRGP